MLDSSEKRRRITKWLLSLFTCCILIYLGFRHISSIAAVILQLLDLAKPLLIGVMLALIFNVPMSFFERYLRTKAGLQHAARPLSIGLSLLLVFGIFIGVTVLVVPEVVKAIKLIVQITGGGLEQLAQMENNTALTSTPLGQLFEKVDIDWLGLKSQMEEWVKSRSGTLVNQVVGAAGSLAGGVITFSIGLIFAVYILAGKERLKHQASRVLHVWLPKRFVEELIHVAAVCSNTFRLFITGQQPKQYPRNTVYGWNAHFADSLRAHDRSTCWGYCIDPHCRRFYRYNRRRNYDNDRQPLQSVCVCRLSADSPAD